MRNFWIILFIIFGQNCFSQKQIDSLQTIIHILKQRKDFEKDTNYINSLSKLIDSYFEINADSMILLAKKSLKLSKKINFSKGEWQALHQIGGGFYAKGDYPRALQYFQKSLLIAEKIKNKLLIAINLTKISEIYRLQNEPEKAHNYDLKALLIFREINNREILPYTLVSIANYYTLKKNYNQAINYHKEALQIVQEDDNLYLMAFVQSSLAKNYQSQRKINIAIDYFLQSLAYYQQNADKLGEIDITNLLASAYFDKPDYPKALDYGLKSFYLAQTMNDKLRIKNASEILTKVYEVKLNFQEALKYYKLFKIYTDSLFNNESHKKIAQLDAKYEYEKREQIFISAQQQKDLEKEIILTRQYLFISIISGVSFTMSIVAWLIFRSREKIKQINISLQQANKEILQSEEEITTQNEELYQKQEEILAQNEELRQKQEEISKLNNHLENLVEERTKKLIQQNNQLNDYAFFNAHKLRAPIATILGLYELLKLEPKLIDKEVVFEKIKTSILLLDEMVYKSQSLLDEVDKESNS